MAAPAKCDQVSLVPVVTSRAPAVYRRLHKSRGGVRASESTALLQVLFRPRRGNQLCSEAQREVEQILRGLTPDAGWSCLLTDVDLPEFLQEHLHAIIRQYPG